MSRPKLTVVLSQAQGKNPAKRSLEEAVAEVTGLEGYDRIARHAVSAEAAIAIVAEDVEGEDVEEPAAVA